MNRNILAFCLLAASVAVCLPARAATDANTAFSNLLANTSTSGPGYYTSGARNVFVAGNLNVWVPHDQVQLISITPPSFSAGCGGISAYFGGLSFISGASFQKLFQDIPALLGYAIELGVRTLCPMCADILAELQKLAQEAAKMSMDSCALAQSLVNTVADKVGVPTGASSCADISSSGGSGSDYMDAMSTLCQGWNTAKSWIDNQIASLTKSNPSQGAALAAQTSNQNGNVLWQQLTLAGYSNTYVKEVILSIQGYTSVYTDAGGTVHNETEPGWTASAGHSIGETLLDIILYGTDPATTAKTLATRAANQPTIYTSVANRAKDIANNAHYETLPFYVCTAADGTVAPAQTPATGSDGKHPYLRMCDTHDPSKDTVAAVGQSGAVPLLTPQGLIISVADTLKDAVNAISAGTKIPPQAIELMQITPLPVYQMVNIAAVFPDVASQLVDNYSEFIAYLIAQEVVSSWLRIGQIPDGITTGISGDSQGAALKALGEMLKDIEVSTKGKMQDISSALTFQDALLASIRQVNDVIYQSVAGTGLQGNLLFVQALAAGQTTGH
jgi:hypothetical protein